MDFVNGETDRITLTARGFDGAGATGATIDLMIINLANGEFFNGVAFQVLAATVLMTESDSVNLPGDYHYDFISPLSDIRIKYRATTPSTNVANGPWEGEAQIGVWVTDVITGRKHVRNRMVFSGNRYVLYEDDKATIFEEGDVTSQNREPDL